MILGSLDRSDGKSSDPTGFGEGYSGSGRLFFLLGLG